MKAKNGKHRISRRIQQKIMRRRTIRNIKRTIPYRKTSSYWKKETEERLILNAVAYNLKRLHNIINGKQNNKEDITNFCESIATTNQLKPNVKIY
jgi:hypothetical protein